MYTVDKEIPKYPEIKMFTKPEIMLWSNNRSYVEKFQMPSKNKKRTNGHVLFIPDQAKEKQVQETLSLGQTNSMLFRVCVLTCQRKLIINNLVLQCFGQYISCPLELL